MADACIRTIPLVITFGPGATGAVGPRHVRLARIDETTSLHPPIGGDCHPRFLGVRDAFRDNFLVGGEVGAAVCVIVRNEVVVDVWGGWVDEARTHPWSADTLVDFYSAGKALVSALALQSVDRGLITLDTHVAEFWPEFAQGGKSAVTVRQALSHQAAVPAIRQILTNDDLFDWDTMTGALAATEAWWPIGARHAYHTNTFGHIVGEIVRRTQGSSAGAALRSVADPLGADVWFGVPEHEQSRCADVIWAPPPSTRPPPQAPTNSAPPSFDPTGLDGDVLMNALAHLNPPGYSSIGVVNTPEWRSMDLPSTAGHGTARGLARFYEGLLEPGRVLSPELLAEASRPQSVGPCPILGDMCSFGLGFTPTTERRPLGPNPRSFGHFGTGGALGFADPDAGVAFGYVMNHVIPRWQSTRNRALIEALYASLPHA
jgi:CubicO group peptidase (beta-lactamase class C family)